MALCNGCNKEFTAARKDAKYCSGACRVKAHRSKNAEPQISKVVSLPATPPPVVEELILDEDE